MLAAEIMERLSWAGVRLRIEAGALIANPSESLTDELRELIRGNKPELLAALSERALEPVSSPLTGLECAGCDRLEMREEMQPGSRRRFWWRCEKGHELLEVRRFGELVTLAPEDCELAGDFAPWRSGTR